MAQAAASNRLQQVSVGCSACMLHIEAAGTIKLTPQVSSEYQAGGLTTYELHHTVKGQMEKKAPL